MTLVLARVSMLRLLRTPRAWLSIGGWTLLAIVAALASRSMGSVNGADHVMRGAFGFIVLPLVTFAVVGTTLGRSGLRQGIRGVVGLGAAPRSAALASILVAVVSSAALCGLLAAIVCGLAHGPQDPPLASDLPTSLWVGALGGAAYSAYFSAGSAIGKGMMRGVFLAFDWLVGSGSAFGSLFTPRGHVTSLLGGSLAAEISQRTSSIALVAIVLAYGLFALRLARKP